MEPTVNTNASAKIIGALIIGLLVGFSAGVFWQERRSGSTSSKEDTSATASKTEAVKGAADMEQIAKPSIAKLLVHDQPAANAVEITNLDTKEIFWIAVREVKDGQLGNILGAQKVLAGNGQKIIVELLRPTVAGGTYKVVAYKDVGTPAFNYREDVIVEGVEGTFMAK